MQKLILTPAATGEDVLLQEPIASLISEGYEVAAVNGFTCQDNKPMCFVLLTASDGTNDDDEFTEEIKPNPDAQDPSDNEPDPDPESEP